MLQDTPIERYLIKGQEVFVKREDLSCKPPGPPFAKVRGLLPVLKDLRKKGIKTVGYMETSISMAGWGVSYFCNKLGMKSVVFMPFYSAGLRHNQQFQLEKWKEFGAEIIQINKPNRMSINYYRARKILSSFPDSFMLPQGLPFNETIEAVSDQLYYKTDLESLGGTIIVCIGSGAMVAGILRGCYRKNVEGECYGILVSKKDPDRIKKKIFSMGKISDKNFCFWGRLPISFSVVDYGYEYTDKEECKCPFPCNPYYDRKAWKWLVDNIEMLKKPILFWNIGA